MEDSKPIEKLFLLSHGAQGDIVMRVCFGKCKKLSVGAIGFEGGTFFPCTSESCDYIDKQLHAGKHEFDFGDRGSITYDITIRKLKENPNA